MRKLLLIFFLTTVGWITASAQTPQAPAQEISNNPLAILDAQQSATGVVIIDDDELGATVSPNPANTSITVNSATSLSDKTFSIYDNLGTLVLQQRLNPVTVTVSNLVSGNYSWIITNSTNKKVGSGTLIIQH